MKILLIILLLMTTALSFCSTVGFHLSNSVAEPWNTWMFDTSSAPVSQWMTPHFNQAGWSFIRAFDRSFYARVSRSYVFAGATIWAPVTHSWVTSVNNFPLITSSMPDTTYYLYFGDRNTTGEFKLVSFLHQNTVNPNNNWDVVYQAGDRRVYGDGIFTVVKNTASPNGLNPVTKLRIYDVYYWINVPYPNYIGTGQPMTAHGWGKIDFTNSDAQWASYFNAKNGQVEFDFTSFSPVVQNGAFGTFDSDLVLKNASIIRYPKSAAVSGFPYNFNTISTNHLSMTTNSGGFYWEPLSQSYSVYTNESYEDPGFTSLDGIDAVCTDLYWEAGNDLDYSSSSLQFNLSEVHGIDVPQNVRIIHRKNGFGSQWEIIPTTIISTNPLVVGISNVSTLGIYALGSSTGNNLHLDTPREIQITVRDENNEVEISWQAVQHAINYNIYASDTPDAPESGWTRVDQVPAGITVWIGTLPPSKKFYHVKAEKY